MKRILYIFIAIWLLAVCQVEAQVVDGGLTRSGEVSTESNLDYLTVSGKLARYPKLSKAGESLKYAPIVTTDSIRNITVTNATVYANILFNGWQDMVVVQGFQICTNGEFPQASTMSVTVIPDNPYVECDQPCATNVFSYVMVGLMPRTTYYVRAFATNDEGTAYGETLSFTTPEGPKAAPIPYYTEFNDEGENGNWMLNNSQSANYWMMGTDPVTQQPAMFITYDGQTPNYHDTIRTTVMSERLLAMTEDEVVTINLDVRIGGESSYDYLKVFLAPKDFTFNAQYEQNAQSSQGYSNYALRFPSGNYYLNFYPGNYSSEYAHITARITNPAPGDTAKLVFLWRSDHSTRTAPGAVISNVEVLPLNVTTDSVTNITHNSAKVYSKLEMSSLIGVQRGICYGRLPGVSMENQNCITVALPTFVEGSSAQTLTGLEYNTTYYVRAYAIYNNAVFYGNELTFKTLFPEFTAATLPYQTKFGDVDSWRFDYIVFDNYPMGDHFDNFWTADIPIGQEDSVMYVTYGDGTQTQYNVSRNSSISMERMLVMPETDSVRISFDVQCGGEGQGGNIYDWMKVLFVPVNEEITSSHYAYDYSTNAMDFSDFLSQTNNADNRPYKLNLTNGTIHIDVKMENPVSQVGDTAKLVFLWRNDGSVGTQPGAVISNLSVTIPEEEFVCGTSTIKDVEDNEYNTVQIGDQCWMKENLRATKTPTGADISGIYSPNGNSENVSVYGYLYTWTAMMNGAEASTDNPSGVQGICPDGWHVPSSKEWFQMEKYLNENGYSCGDNSSFRTVSKAMAADVEWTLLSSGETINECAPASRNNNNTSQFTALPAGYYSPTYNFVAFNSYASLWSCTGLGINDNVSSECISPNSASPSSLTLSKQGAASLRCVKDAEQEATVPEVKTLGSSYYQENNDYIMEGEVVSDGGSALTERGVCCSDNYTEPTLDNSFLVLHYSSAEEGTYNIGLSAEGLTPGATYYFRAYATNGVGTAYGEVMSFTVDAPVVDLMVDNLPYDNGFTDSDRWYFGTNYGNNYWTIGELTGNTTNSLYVTNDDSVATHYDISTPTDAYAVKLLYMPAVDSVYVSFDLEVGGEGYSQGNIYDFLTVALSAIENVSPTNGLIDEQYVSYILDSTYNTTIHVNMKVENPAPEDTAKLIFRWRNDYSAGTQPAAIISNLKVTVTNAVSCPASFTDTRDNTVYHVMQVGNNCWMAENLRYINGDLPVVYNQYSDNTPYLYAPNDDNSANNIANYGYLYNWTAAINSASSTSEGMQGLCPAGWHLPTEAEAIELVEKLDSDEDFSAQFLKASGYYLSSSSNNPRGFGSCDWYWITYNEGQHNACIPWCTDNSSTNAISTNSNMANALSIRCVKNSESGATVPEVNTIGSYYSTLHGDYVMSCEVVSDGGSALIERGVCYSKTETEPTLDNGGSSFYETTTEVGPYYMALSNVTLGATYYFRAYATNSEGTAYGETKTFYVCGGDLTDTRNNQTYQTMMVDDVCWMKENLRYQGNPLFTNGDYNNVITTSEESAYIYYPGGQAGAFSTYGYLYNWAAATNNASVTSQSMQGVCPDGWHLPTYAEANALKNKLNQDATFRAAFLINHAGIVRPSGSSGAYEGFGQYDWFWVAQSGNDTNASLDISQSTMLVGGSGKAFGRSIRCVKN